MSENNIKLNVTGMACGGCAANVQQALLTVANVSEVEIDLPANTAVITVNGTPPSIETLIDSVRQAGYDASSAGRPS